MTVTSPDRTTVIEEKLDALSDQLAQLAAYMDEQRRRSTSWDELKSDITPLLGQAVATASRELEDVQDYISSDDILRLIKRLVRNTNRIEQTLERFESVLELVDDVGGLTDEAFLKLVRTLETFEERGYFSFARAGLGVMDQVVTGFSEDEVESLGDNVVTILNTVKEITQPEMLVLLQRMIDALQRQQSAIEQEPDDPPSLWALLRRMRDPDVRKGINRALATLGSVSAETGPEVMKAIHQGKGDS